MRRLRWTALALLPLLLLPPAAPARAAVAAGFDPPATVFSVSSPTALTFTPDESLLLVASKGGQLRVADVSAAGAVTLRPTAALDLSARVCTESERGLLGVAADPNFAANRYVYLYYTYDRGVTGGSRCRQTDGTSAIDSSSPVNRVSRFTVGPAGTVDPASEGVLVDNMPSPAGNHNGGDVHFGKDGYLYISVGDGGCDYAGGGCAGGNDATRDSHALLGKVLRIIPDPTLAPAQRVPASNPFRAAGVVCAAVGVAAPGSTCQETFAFGLRNPFRTAFDPDTVAPATRFFINDVGQGIWEEIDVGEAGADYRWNTCEGSYKNGTRTLCAAPTGAQRNPIHEYDHSDSQKFPDTVGCTSITGGAFVPQGVWPAGYGGSYLFADYVCGKIFQITPSGAPPYQRATFATNVGAPTSLTFGPAPGGVRALYYADIGSGQVKRIAPSAAGNRAPTAAIAASPQYGSATVTFDGSASFDPDGDALTYLWDFGNGATRQTSTATTAYTYPAGGRFTAKLQVRDPDGALSNVAALTIDTLDTPPVATMTSPAQGATFGVGDTITLQGSATDAEDGQLAGAALSWTVLLHHRAGQVGSHTHPYFGPQTGATLTFQAPAPEDLDAAGNSYLEVILTATDSAGAATVVRRDLLPEKVTVVVQTVPAGMAVAVNGVSVPDGAPVVSWRGYQLTLAALPQRAPDGRYLALGSWEDGTKTTVRTVVTPDSAATYTATFSRTASVVFLPVVREP